jgi:hypothetical protein
MLDLKNDFMKSGYSDNEFEVATAITIAITLLAATGFIVAIWQLFVHLFGR